MNENEKGTHGLFVDDLLLKSVVVRVDFRSQTMEQRIQNVDKNL